MTEGTDLLPTPLTPNIRPRRSLAGALRTLALPAAALLAGCAVAPPQAPAESPEAAPLHLGRVQHREAQGVAVQLAIPTDAEVTRRFGIGLAAFGIQPIWLKLDNTSEVDYWVQPVAIDPDYFSADEAAFIAAGGQSGVDARSLRDRLRASALPFFVQARSSQEGFVYASHARGGRLVDVRLTGRQQVVRMRFAVLLPTQGFDYERSALRQLYAQVQQLPDLSLVQTRERLRSLPCCATDASGTGTGDPLNLVLVGSGEAVIAALGTSGWQFTEAITADSVRRMVGAAIAAQSFQAAPVSALFTFGRAQDIAMQRGRATISQRNHLRLWLAPFRCEGQPVWVGQVSRDIGVKLTTRSPSFTTHVIDPVVDESREYLFQSLLHHDAVDRFAFVQGVGTATEAAPHRNLTDDPYFTDGMRLVVWLSSTPVPPHLARDLGWNASADPTREGQGRDAMVPALVDPPKR